MANNNSKQIWMTILIAAIVGILSSVITASIVSKNVLLGPQEAIKVIKAHSCNADGICEINEATISRFEGGSNDQKAVCSDAEGNLFISNTKCWNDIEFNCGSFFRNEPKKILELTARLGEKVEFREGERVYEGEFLVIPEFVLKVSRIIDQQGGYSNDRVEFTDTMTGTVYLAEIIEDKHAILQIPGEKEEYLVMYTDDNANENDKYVTFDFPQTSNEKKMNLELCF